MWGAMRVCLLASACRVCAVTFGIGIGGAPSGDRALGSRWKHRVIHADRSHVHIELHAGVQLKQHDVVLDFIGHVEFVYNSTIY